MRAVTVLAAVASLGLTVSAHAAETFSFETPALNGGYEYAPGFEGYSSNGQAASESNVVFLGTSGIQSNGSAFGFADTTAGTQTAFLQSYTNPSNGSQLTNGAITLDLGKLVTGKTYDVSFVDAARPNYGGASFSLTYGGKTVAYTPVSTMFAPQMFSFTAGQSSGLTFAALQGSTDVATAIDNVTVSAVPEPATWALTIFGMGALGLALRRQRRGSGGRTMSAIA